MKRVVQPRVQRAAQPRVQRAIQLLIAEDSDDDARMVVRVLERAGFKVQYEIVSTDKAMRAALDRQAWDAVISDYEIPGFGGLKALGLMQARRLDIPFVLISGAVGEEIAVEALKAGVNDYVLKKNLQRLPAVLERELRESEVRGGLRRAEAALRESEQRLRTIVESEPECVKVVSREGQLLEMNSAGLAMLECDSLATARAHPLLEFIVPEHRQAFGALHQRVIAGGTGTLEFEVVGLKGGRRWLETHAAPLAAANGDPMLLGVTRDITGRRRIEEELRRFKLAMDQSADVIFIIDRASMRHVEFNETACRLLGYTRAELLKMGPQDILPVGRAELEQTYDALIADPSLGGGMQSYYRCRDGSQLPFESTRQVLRSDGRWLIVAVARDIRRRIASQAALRESEQRYRAVFEAAAVGIVHSDLAGRFLMVNPKICEIMGFTQEELLARSFPELTHPDDIAASVEHRSRLLEGHAISSQRELRALRKGGGYVWVNVATSLVRAADGSPAHYIAILQDISERKRAEQELQRFGMAMDVSADSIYLTDPAEMRFVYLNATACRRLGYTREQLLQMGPQDVLPIGREEIKREYAEVVAAGRKGMIHERTYVRRDGSLGWTELHRRALQTDAGTLIITIGRDVTERKEAEERVIRLNRIYLVLSGVNGAIVRIRERGALFSEICRIAVAEGGYIVARLVTMDANGQADLAATTEADSLSYQRDIIAEYNADREHCQNFLAVALRSGEAQISNDVANDVRIPRRAALTKAGNYALALLPFKVEGRVAGVLMLRAAAAGAFNEEEMRLLRELVGNLSFALELMDKQQRLDHLAFYDALTGLANRSLLIERLSQSIRAAAPAQGKLAIVLADLERLRTVNESLGRQAGDTLLREVAQRLAASAGHGEVARLGVDNFAVVLQGVKGRSEVTRRIERLWQDCFGKAFRLGGAEFRAGARAGVALYPNDGIDAETLLGNAEAALRRAKQTGERHVFHSLEMTAATGEKLTLETSLRQALEKNEFVLHYQPKVDLVTRRIVGVEGLIRWQNPALGLVPPGQFIPLMEETGLILEVGAWALARAVDDHARWQGMALSAPRIAVNVSAIQLRRRDFVATVEKALGSSGKAPGIDVEITESLAMQDVEGNVEKLKALRALGLSVAIDDFGTGYSSLGYLAKLPVQALKIDRSFIITMLTDPDTMTLVSTIISLAHSLRLKVVAEGVENEDQAKVLRLLRCDEMQGYLFSKPLPFDDLTALLQREAKAA